jgi:NAD(P)H-hydrate epimerase
MPKIMTVAEMKALEAAADQGASGGAGVSYAAMMENAGRAVAEAVLARLDDPATHKVLVLCGPGNNGGDGMVAAHYLSNAGLTVTLYFVRLPDENDANFKRLREKSLFIAEAANDQRGRVLKNLAHSATVIIDAIFGTGARLPITGQPAEVLKDVGAALNERAQPPLVVAVDCPSGLNCDTGELDPLALRADVTVTFAAGKRGQFVFPAADALGELIIADIGIPSGLPELSNVSVDLATAEAVSATLPRRPRHAHKGTFGRAYVAAGSVNYTGAAYLAGAAAYRVGAGLVTLAVPAPLHPILAGQLPEATWVLLPSEMGAIASSAHDVIEKELTKASALLIGPGLGTDKSTGAFVRRVLNAEAGSARRGQIGFAPRPQASPESAPAAEAPKLPPLVVDADGLRLLSEIEDWPKALPPNTVLTPHPGEMAALTGQDKDALQADRIGTALRYAADWGHVIVLKGAFTVVAGPNPSGRARATVLPFATPALARAGTGDVLAGAIVGLLAQGLAPYEAAVAAAYVHGRAGELAASALGTTASVIAGDVLDGLAEVLAELGVG